MLTATKVLTLTKRYEIRVWR